MMKFLIAPDFPPEDFAGWHLFNTQLQRLMECTIRLVMPLDHHEQEELLAKNDVDLVYANPFDASKLIREQGYLPLARPNGRPDEMIIAGHAQGKYMHSDDLQAGCKILITENQDVQLLGLRLLESAAIGRQDIEWLTVESYQEAARRLIEQEADAAFFLASAYRSFRQNTLNEMRILMESRINDLTHVVLLHPKHADLHPQLLTAFVHMVNEPNGKMVLSDLNMPQGFSELDTEDAEFMIDLIDTLRD